MDNTNNSNTLVIDTNNVPKFEDIESVHLVSPRNRLNLSNYQGTPIYRSSSEWVCFYHEEIDFLNDGQIVSLWNGVREIKVIIVYSKYAYKASMYERVSSPRDYFLFGFVMDEQPIDSPYQKSHLIFFRQKYIYKSYF